MSDRNQLTIHAVLQRVGKHFRTDKECTPEVAADLAAFIAAQAEPHGVLDTVNGVLTAWVTGVDDGATFPVSPDAYPTQMSALLAACEWLSNNGAVTVTIQPTVEEGERK